MAMLDEALEYRFGDNAQDEYDYLCAIMISELSEDYLDHKDDFIDLVKAKYYKLRMDMEDYLKEFSPWLIMELDDISINGNEIIFPRPSFRRT